MPILLFILIFVLAVILIIFSMFRRVLAFIFGGFRGQSNQQYSGSMGGRDRRGQNHSSTSSQVDEQKVFAENEGEYVSYEEVE